MKLLIVKNMKKISILFIGLSSILLSSCHFVSSEADEETVLIDKPWFFGHGGVDDTPVTTGLTWCWWSTSSETFKITPQRFDEAFDDIFSNDNTPLDFNTYINIQIEQGKSPILLKNYGTNWYKNNIQVYYRNKTREYVSIYSPFDLISNREVLNKIDSALISDMRKYVAELSKKKEFPITILSVTTGAAKPNKDQLEEMNKTAQYIQQKRSMEQKAIAETARVNAEKKRAEADKAYMVAMNLNPNQFISLKWIETIANKNGANIDVLVGGGETPMWNIKR
jgi:regulator of protease activity HflC (stomatin/prohibitin superfamily)